MLFIINHTQLILYQDSIRIVLYCLLHGQDAKILFDWNAPKACTPKEKLNQDKASILVRQLQKAHTIAKNYIVKAQK
jgi:hypothetical protein